MKNGTWKHIFRSLSPYKLHIAASIICSAVSVILTLYIPIRIGAAIDRIIGAGKVDFGEIMPILYQVLIMAAVSALMQWMTNIINNRVAYNTLRDMRGEAFAKIQSLPLSYLDTHPSGELTSRVIADAESFSDGLLLGFTQLFTGVLTILGTLCFMLTINVGITLAVVLLTPISIFVAKFIAKHTYSMFGLQSKTRGEQTSFIDEMIAGVRTVKAFRRGGKVVADFDEINDRLEKCSLQATFYSSLTNPSTRFLNSLVYACVALVGAITAIGGGISVGMLSSFLSYANQYAKPFNEISGVIAEFQGALASAARLYELIDETPEVPDNVDSEELTDASGSVDFRHVSFSYTPERPLIRDVNISVSPGQHVAIVGPTGCGKTTLINLLMRFYDVTGGQIDVDGHDIRSLTRHSLRANYGMVLQDTWLKSATVRENIKLGKPDATDEEMIDAARAAHADGFIAQLPHGYDTVLGEGGEGLSQGQKQLLSIARIMLCLPPMLILDEATSSIDTRTEQRISRAFTEMMRGRTTFIVAHRLSTIRESDCILVMKDGDIIEQGTHDELLARGGFYRHLWESQFAIE